VKTDFQFFGFGRLFEKKLRKKKALWVKSKRVPKNTADEE
jgi:hypothetical protein